MVVKECSLITLTQMVSSAALAPSLLAFVAQEKTVAQAHSSVQKHTRSVLSVTALRCHGVVIAVSVTETTL